MFECKHKIYNRLWEAERDLQGLQEGETNQVKAVHTAVQKILTLLLIHKSQRNWWKSKTCQTSSKDTVFGTTAESRNSSRNSQRSRGDDGYQSKNSGGGLEELWWS